MLLSQLKPQETRVKRRKEGVGESEEGARESVLSDDPPDSKYLFISQEIHSDSEYPFISQEIYPDSKYSFISQNYWLSLILYFSMYGLYFFCCQMSEAKINFKCPGTRLKFLRSFAMYSPMTGTLSFTRSISSRSRQR